MRQTINSVLASLPRSGIRKITDRVMALSQDHQDVIHLGLGQPQEPTPRAICEAAAEAALKGFTKYTLNAGWLELRKAVQAKLRRWNRVEVDLDDIFITPGATYGVSIAVGTLINVGDEVLVPDPGYPNFASCVLHYGGKVKYYTLQEANGFQIDFDELDSLVSEKTKLLIINSPSNPTGAVFPEGHVQRLVDYTAKKHLWLLSDEVYEAFVYSGKHISPLSYPDSDHVLGVYSFSKTYNMTGLRVGYTVTKDKQLYASFINAQELYISSAPSVSQAAALRALQDCDGEVKALTGRFHQKLNLALDLLQGEVHYVPQGAFYILVDIRKTGLSSDEFADLLLEEKRVAVAPGATFGPSSDRFIRIALTAEAPLLKEGIQRIKEFIRERSLSKISFSRS